MRWRSGPSGPNRKSGIMRATSLVAVAALLLAACGEDSADEPEADEPETEVETDDPVDEGEDEAEDEGEDIAEGDEEDYFAGRDVELIVPFGPGGGTDVTARAIAPFLADALGANSVNVVNIPGAASIPGSNEFALRGADDVDFMMSSATTHNAYFLREPGVRFDMNDWRGVMGIPTGSPTVLAPEVGFTGENYDKLLDPDVPIVHSGISITGADLRTVMAYEVLGMDVQYVFGYDGLGPARLAFEQGESNSTTQSMGGFLTNVVPLIEAGEAVPLYTVGVLQDGELVRDDVTPDIPTIAEVHEELYGEPPSGPEWEALLTLIAANNVMQKILIMHADTPDAKFEQAQRAVDEMLANPELQEAAEAAFGDYEPFTGEDVEEQLQRIASPDPEVLDWIFDYLADEWDTDLRDD